MPYEEIINSLCDLSVVLTLLLPVCFFAGIEHEKKANFKRYEQARLAYSAERLRRIRR